jgi:Piwi domain
LYENVNSSQKDPQAVKNPKIGFVIVNKRTNARFVTTGGKNGFDNPQPGTIVDDTITMPER